MYVILVDEKRKQEFKYIEVDGCLSARTMLDNIKSQAEWGLSDLASAEDQNDIDDVSRRFKEILDMSKIALAKLEEAGLSSSSAHAVNCVWGSDPDYFKVGGTD